MKERVGVLGGSFDPVHYGHLILAEQIKTEAELDRILFVPAYVSPFKIWNKPADKEHRLRMLELAIGDHRDFQISTIELDRDEPSYTYATLKALQEQGGDRCDYHFIVGTDAFMHIEEWHHSRELLSEFSFLIGLRKGYDEEKLIVILDDLSRRYPLKATYIPIPELEISASDLRDRMAAGKSVKFLLPDAVIDYIEAKGLYRDTARLLREFVRKRLDAQRFAHTERTVAMARQLANRFGADPEKAEIAAWFHDAYRETGKLAHAPKAALELEQQFGIRDEEILNAVRYHTTGRAGMGLLEKIIYLADYIEEGRDYKGVEALRRHEGDDIDAWVLRMLKSSRDYIQSLNKSMHPASLEAISDLEQRLIQRRSPMTVKKTAEFIAQKLQEKKARDVLIIDISARSGFADYFVLATAGNIRQLASLAEEVEKQMAQEGGSLRHIEGKERSGWILMDYGDVIVNLFSEDQRAHYQLEKIWSDCAMWEPGAERDTLLEEDHGIL